jgi:diadenosine tetraphosphate (Ap4A) HIT family hydrolase
MQEIPIPEELVSPDLPDSPFADPNPFERYWDPNGQIESADNSVPVYEPSKSNKGIVITRSKNSRCYTCKPRGKVKRHIITETSDFTFHHDMHERPVIIITPIKHIKTINDLSSEELTKMFKDIHSFVDFWNIEDYQISFNAGQWQNNEHFHCKLRATEKIINRMRRDHFQKSKLESLYTSERSE